MNTYGYDFEWTRDTGRASISGSGFSTKEESDRNFVRGLEVCHYELPRFWQWWRWGERRPSVWRMLSK